MNIAIVDDHALVAESLMHMLMRSVGNANIKTYSNADSFFKQGFDEWVPDLVICDILMPGMGGLDLIEKAMGILPPGCNYLMLSSITDVYTIKTAMRKGVSGYVSKDSSLEEMLEAIATVQNGEQYISQSLKEGLLKHMFAEEQIVFHLSPREKEVLNKICAGQTPKEIAYDMNLSIHTIQQYHKNIMRKFKVNRTTDLVVFAMQKGLYNPEKI